MNRYLTAPRTSTAVLLLVDFQERLMPVIHAGEAVLDAARRLTLAAGVFELPVLVTEQYPAGLGRTCAPLSDCLPSLAPFEKTLFSACVPAVIDRLAEFGRPNVIVTGVETHVCVQQSVLDLLRLGYSPYVCADAVGSRRELDRNVAIERLRQAGAIITTTESMIFELTRKAGTEPFKRVLGIVKGG